MELVLLLAMGTFFLVLVLAPLLGLAVDSRDSADWKPTEGGRRWSPHAD